MPELPEVETVRFDLNRILSGYKVLDIWSDTPKMLSPRLATMKKKVVGRTIKEFSRRGKYIFVTLGNDAYLVIHLKMTGRLLIRDPGVKEDRWTHVIFYLKKNKLMKELRFANQRKFGYVRFADKNEVENIKIKLGPEPLDDLTYETFDVRIGMGSNRKTPPGDYQFSIHTSITAAP